MLRHLASEQGYRLTAEFHVGRGPRCALHIDNPLASTVHAVLQWTGACWMVRDLHSRNGTWVNGRLLASGERAELEAGARLAFGEENEAFELSDAAAPQAIATSEAGVERIGEDGLLVLPDADRPVVTLFATEAGNWLAEWNDGTRRPVRDGATLDVLSSRWNVSLPVAVEPTLQASSARARPARLALHFAVSRDEETVDIEFTQGDEHVALPARAHGYLLVTLARARVADQGGDTAESEHGWMYIPELVDMLRTNENQFNVSIYRARRQFARAGMKNPTTLFERRTGARQIRIGTGQLTIVQS